MKLVNKSDYDTKEISRLVRIVVSKLKKSLAMPPLGTILVESYDSAKWEGHFDGKDTIKIRLGRKTKYPNTWDRILAIPNWEDCFVGMLTWCVCLHYQRAMWAKKPFGSGNTKYSRTGCQEITVRVLTQWRVESEIKMIYEKAGIE